MASPVAVNSRQACILVFLSLLASDCCSLLRGVACLGINYGRVADNLPPPDHVLALLSSLKIDKARIYDADPRVLAAFANSGVELIVTVPNQVIAAVTEPQQALQWVMTHVKPYFPATNISGIAVGNEVYTTGDRVLMADLVPAMVGIHGALVRLGLDRHISVSSATSLAVLQTSYPPSAGAFRPELLELITPFLRFLAAARSAFWVNAYPYFAYKDAPGRVPLDYVLLNPNPGLMTDPYTRLRYDNMLYAQVDAVVFAMARLGFGGVEVRVAETGWSSKGDADEAGATAENARTYAGNLVLRQLRSEGTPVRPNQRLEVYVFALFDEDMKPGPTSERNYGLFKPNGSMAYDVGFVSSSAAAAASVSLTSSSVRASGMLSGSMWHWLFMLLILPRLS